MNIKTNLHAALHSTTDPLSSKIETKTNEQNNAKYDEKIRSAMKNEIRPFDPNEILSCIYTKQTHSRNPNSMLTQFDSPKCCL